MHWLWGLLVGWLSAATAAFFVARASHRRMLALQQRAKEAERLAELGTLTGGLAHEIKNPLSTVQLNLQLLQEDLLPSNPAYGRLVNRLGIAARETGRLREILDDFLRYAGRIELSLKPVELNTMLEEMVDFFTPQAQLQRIRLRLKKADPPVSVSLDERLIKQAVLNLMLNALQAMPQGGELILQAERAEGEARIDVIDTGRGIDPEAQARIFDAYYSTKHGGTGLGLAMTRRILLEHGGRISLRSEPGRGSDFTLHLKLPANKDDSR